MKRHSKFIAVTMGLLCLCHFSFASGLTNDVRKRSPLTTKGDLYTFSTLNTRLAVGANGTVLSADSSTATGLKWAALPVGGSGTVTNSGTLTSNAVIIGGGTTVVSAITADSATTGHALFSTATSPAFRQILTSDLSGTLSVSNGGSGISSGTTNKFVYFQGTNLMGSTGLISTDGTRIAVGPGTSSLISVDVAGSIRSVPITLTDAQNVTIDAAAGNFFVVTLGGAPRNLNNPLNGVFGQKIIVIISQDGTGSRKIGFGSNFSFGSDITTYDATTTAGMHDMIGLIKNTNSWDVVATAKGFR